MKKAQKYEVKNKENQPVIFYHSKKGINFDYNSDSKIGPAVELTLDKSQLEQYIRLLSKLSESIWTDIAPKEANSLRNDYDEYYDREFDNNGGACIRRNGNIAIIKFYPPAYHLGSNRLYRFTKTKIESYLYDLLKLANKLTND